MTFQDWLGQVRALKALYEEALEAQPINSDSEEQAEGPLQVSGADGACCYLSDSEQRARYPLRSEGRALLDKLRANRSEWESELSDPEALLCREFLDENIPAPMERDFVGIVTTRWWDVVPSAESVPTLADWLDAVFALREARARELSLRWQRERAASPAPKAVESLSEPAVGESAEEMPDRRDSGDSLRGTDVEQALSDTAESKLGRVPLMLDPKMARAKRAWEYSQAFEREYPLHALEEHAWDVLLFERLDAWRDELVSLAERVDSEFLADMSGAHCKALLKALAMAAPVGSLPLRVVELGLKRLRERLPRDYEGSPPSLEDDARLFLRHLGFDEFDWDEAPIETAWDDFLDFCEQRYPEVRSGMLSDCSKLCVIGHLLGPARFAVYWAAVEGWSNELLWDVYEDGPPWLDELAEHLIALGRPGHAYRLAYDWDGYEYITGLGGGDPAAGGSAEVMERARRELDKRRMSGVDMAQAYVEEQVGAAFRRVSNKTRECLISAAIAVSWPSELPGTAASELWLALEAEWKYQVKRFRALKAADYHEDLGTIDWVREIIDGPVTRVVWDFLNSRRGKALRDGRAREWLRRLRDLRNAHEHEPESVKQEELRAVMRVFWEEGLLREYLECLLPSPRG